MENMNIKKQIPSLEEAILLLEEGNKLNPGNWIDHSLNVGKSAQLIAVNCIHLDSEVALILGMMHDIGRRFGVTSMRHSIDGYNFLMEKDYDLAARICMTHSFPYKDINAVFGTWDCHEDELKFIDDFLKKSDYDDYDKLIQLCDALALPSGYCLMEKRMVDVALRHGVNEYTVKKWNETFKIKNYFEEKMGQSIYDVLPRVIENTFNKS